MPKRLHKDRHEPLFEEQANTRNVRSGVSSLGVKRDAACRHYWKNAAFAARWKEALRWQTALLRKPS